MGAACVAQATGLPADADGEQIRERYRVMKEYAAWECGHGGYTGTIAEAAGLEVRRDLRFASTAEALDRIDEYAWKWGPAVAVVVADEIVFVGIYSE